MAKLTEWYRDKNDTLFIVSHYYEELEQMADKILILDKGKVIAYGKKEELFRKYCGNGIFILENSEENRKLAENFSRIKAPENLLAISCKKKEEEKKLIQLLVEEDVNFKRSNNDIEIMFINAKEHYYKSGKEGGNP